MVARPGRGWEGFLASVVWGKGWCGRRRGGGKGWGRRLEKEWKDARTKCGRRIGKGERGGHYAVGYHIREIRPPNRIQHRRVLGHEGRAYIYQSHHAPIRSSGAFAQSDSGGTKRHASVGVAEENNIFLLDQQENNLADGVGVNGGCGGLRIDLGITAGEIDNEGWEACILESDDEGGVERGGLPSAGD